MDKVLIADEDAQLLMILADSLDKYKNYFEIVTVKNGLEAILALQKQTFAAVVTEIRMPKVNGLVLMGYLSKNYPDMPCIVMAEAYSDMLKRRLDEAAIAYVEKPFKIKELSDAIFSLLDRRETFGGKLKGMPLLGFLTLIESEHLSCVCEVSTATSGKGYFLFSNGVLHNAKQGVVLGEDAAVRLLALEDVTIKYRRLPQQHIPRVIRSSVSELARKS